MIKKRRSSGKKPADPVARRKSLEKKEQVLHARIGQLEDFIASSPFRDRKHSLSTRDIIPPPECRRQTPAKREKRLNRKHKEAVRQERHQHLFNFFCLFLLLCAMFYWLFHSVF